MTRIFIDHADAGGHLDLVALDSNGLGAILKKPAEGAMRLKADQEHGGPVVPQPMFEMMANAAGVAHAACRDNDMKAGQFCDRFAFVDCLGESEMWRVEQAIDVDIPIEASSVFSEHLGRVNRERRIEKYRRGRYLAAFHQVDQIDDQFLGAFDREGGDQQRAFCACGVADLSPPLHPPTYLHPA